MENFKLKPYLLAPADFPGQFQLVIKINSLYLKLFDENDKSVIPEIEASLAQLRENVRGRG